MHMRHMHPAAGKRVALRMALWTLAIAATMVLGGCATTRMIDSEVSSFTGASAPAAQASYRFERLPSQQASARQDAWEAMAAQALSKVGLRPATTPPAQLTVLLSVQVAAQNSPYQRNPPGNVQLGGMWGMGSFSGMGLGLQWMTPPPSWWRHTVQLILRDSASQQVLYETSATFDGPWSDTDNLLPPMLEAALQDYPTPPRGPRKVVIALPPPQAQ